MTLKMKVFENIMGKGENADYKQFLLFPQYFRPVCREFSSPLSPANAFNLDQFKILVFGKELKKRKSVWNGSKILMVKD